MDGCKRSDDVVQCESGLTTINDTLKSSADLFYHLSTASEKSLIDKNILSPKPFASKELKYFQEAPERVKVFHKKIQEASNKLATTLTEAEKEVSISHWERSTIAQKK